MHVYEWLYARIRMAKLKQIVASHTQCFGLYEFSFELLYWRLLNKHTCRSPLPAVLKARNIPRCGFIILFIEPILMDL